MFEMLFLHLHIYRDGDVKCVLHVNQKKKKTTTRMALDILWIFKDLIDFHIFSRLIILLQKQPLLQDAKEKASKKIGTHLNKGISMSYQVYKWRYWQF